jgi:hypothetical protein
LPGELEGIHLHPDHGHGYGENIVKGKEVERELQTHCSPCLQIRNNILTDLAEVADSLADHYEVVSDSLGDPSFLARKRRFEMEKLDFYANQNNGINSAITATELQGMVRQCRKTAHGGHCPLSNTNLCNTSLTAFF